MSDGDVPEHIDRPVLLVPGIGGTFGSGECAKEWFTTRGIEPERAYDDPEKDGMQQVIEIDPLGGYYYDIITSLENVGYELDTSLFVVTYDWRVEVGPSPDDGDEFDGTVDLGGAKSITPTPDEEFRWGVDYFGYYLQKAAEAWEAEFGEVPDSVDVVSHSTGGLVTRAYLQSEDAYNGVYDESGNRLPKVHDFAMIGVPNRGASKAWNPLHNDFGVDHSYQFVTSKIAYQALFMLENDDDVEKIEGPNGDITFDQIYDEDSDAYDYEQFVASYAPTIRNLLATYPFLIEGDELTPRTINHDEPDEIAQHRNNAVLNLNDGLDYDASPEEVFDGSSDIDPNAFVDQLAGDGKALVICSGDKKTVTYAVERNFYLDFEFPPPVVGMHQYIGRFPAPGTRWFEDREPSPEERNGDSTVPLESSCGQFLNAPRTSDDGPIEIHGITPDESDSVMAGLPNVQLHEIPDFDDPEDAPIGHTGLAGNREAQQVVLEQLVGKSAVSEADISTGKVLALSEYAGGYATFAGLVTLAITAISRGIYDNVPSHYRAFVEDIPEEFPSLFALDSIVHTSAKGIESGVESVADRAGDRIDELSALGQVLEEELGISFVAYHGDRNNRPAMGIRFHENFEGSGEHLFGDGWSFNWETTGEFTLELLVQPARSLDESVTVELRWLDNDDPSADATVDAELGFDPADTEAGGDEAVVLGSPGGSRVAVRSFDLAGSASYEQASGLDDPEGVPLTDVGRDDIVGTGELSFEAPLSARIVADPDGFDGFTSKILSGVDVDAEFDMNVGWSSESGFYFGTGGDMEVTIPKDTSLGPITLEQITLAAREVPEGALAKPEEPPEPDMEEFAEQAGEDLEDEIQAEIDELKAKAAAERDELAAEVEALKGDIEDEVDEAKAEAEEAIEEFEDDLDDIDELDIDADERAIRFQGSMSGRIELGPMTGTVTRVGVEAELSFPEDGEPWPPEVQLGIKPPDGVGLSIDSGVVTGGGYLEFDRYNDRYAGVVQLKVGEFSINAIGLLSTDLPGDRDGYSLLLLITGEFPPIQLGFGFTLNGVGGIVGLHRSIKTDPLGRVVRDGSLDSILFPEDPIANSQRIISDLRQVFPVTPDTHVFGPIVRLGWGTPTVVTADLGVVLEVPTVKIVILGNFAVTLPEPNAPLIELNLAASGVIDPENERVAVDASLYDSRLLQWSLSGDMALRSRAGDDPRFVLSVGGFNPRFEPPDDIPELDRITASLGPPGGNPKIEYKGYFAVTSNTLQAGAGQYLEAEAGPASVEGEMSFDALIQFDPFEFVADFYAELTVDVGKTLSITIEGTITGPGPIRIQGQIEIDLFLISVSASLDVSFGEGSSVDLPGAKVMPELTEALGRPENWETHLPDIGENFATLRDIDVDDDEVLAHPLSEIGVRQTITPLQYEIEKFGEAEPSGLTKFEIAGAEIEDAVESALDLAAEATEQFAPAQYTIMSATEKIDAPAFEDQIAGRKIRDTGIYLGYDDDEQREANVQATSLQFNSIVIDSTFLDDPCPLERMGAFPTADFRGFSGFEPGAVDALEDVGAVAHSDVRTTGVERFRLSDADLAADRARTAGEPIDGDGLTRGGENPDIGGISGRISRKTQRYVIVESGSLESVEIPTAEDGPMSKSAAKRALERYRKRQPTIARELRVVPTGKATTEER